MLMRNGMGDIFTLQQVIIVKYDQYGSANSWCRSALENRALGWYTVLSRFIRPIMSQLVWRDLYMTFWDSGRSFQLSCLRYSQVKITGMRCRCSLISKLTGRVAFQAAFLSHSQLSWMSKLNPTKATTTKSHLSLETSLYHNCFFFFEVQYSSTFLAS